MVMGRPTKLTKKVRDKVVQALEIGATLEIAALSAGITYQTFNNWRKAGEGIAERLMADSRLKKQDLAPQDKQLFQFFEAVEKAIADSAMLFLAPIFAAAVNDPRWAAWMLERRFPYDYGVRVGERVQSSPQGNWLDDATREALEELGIAESEAVQTFKAHILRAAQQKKLNV
jgi:hypothetical protein